MGCIISDYSYTDIKEPKSYEDVVEYGNALGKFEFGIVVSYILEEAIIHRMWTPVQFLVCEKLLEMEEQGLIMKVEKGYLLSKKALAILIENCPS